MHRNDSRNATSSGVSPIHRVDRIYVAATAHDARLARICIASIREYYADIPIYLLPGGPLKQDFVEEVDRFWNVKVADIPAGEYGWGFVKFEPLFMEPGISFLMIDADTVMTGPVLDQVPEEFRTKNNASSKQPDGDGSGSDQPESDETCDFIIDNEVLPAGEVFGLYFDCKKLESVTGAQFRPDFLFNTGQWCGRTGMLNRDVFSRWVEWSMPRALRHPEMFFCGDQGVLNLVVNQMCQQDAIRVRRVPLMHWPGWGMREYDAKSISAGKAPVRIIHWAGVKAARIGAMPGSDVLLHFEKRYYNKIPNGRYLRLARSTASTTKHWYRNFKTWLRLFWQKKIAKSIS